MQTTEIIDACGLESSMPCLGFPPLSVNRLASPHLSHTLPRKTGDCSKMSHPVVASSRQLWTTTAITYSSNVGRTSGLSASRLLQLTDSLFPITNDSLLLDVGAGTGAVILGSCFTFLQNKDHRR